ncbi:hypothetical protein LCL95_15500 [Bacillus timonensis]|nr:hypothetical protein [Bacillus timonensis]
MKKLFLCFLFIFFVFIMGCSSTAQQEKYYLLIIQGEENISDKFSEFANSDYLVTKVEYLTSLEVAKEKYPNYKIEKTPAVFIFETGGGEMKKLKLKTYDIEEAVQFLKGKRKE